MPLNKELLKQAFIAADVAAIAASKAGADEKAIRENRAEAYAIAIDSFVRTGTVKTTGAVAPGIAVALTPIPVTSSPGVAQSTGTIT